MKTSTFLNCLSYNGVSTGTSGTVLGIYDFASGSGINNNLSLIYNLLNPTGSHYSGNAIYGPALPLVSVGTGNVSGNQFSGLNAYRMGFTVSGDFSVLLDIDYNGCARSTSNVSYVLLSTADATTGLSGNFYIGINDVNRLYFETSGYLKTLSYELKPSNMVYVSLGNRKSVEFGVFDIQTQSIFSERVTLSGSQNLINKLYVGGFLNNTNKSYTGFSGKIYSAVLNNKTLDLTGLSNCAMCMFATGAISGSPTVTNISIPYVTGYSFSGFLESVITGYTSSTGTIIKADNSTVSLVFPSGMTGLKQTSEIASILTGNAIFQITGTTPVAFQNDTGRIFSYTKYDVEFDYQLVSGDTVEIYTYPSFNPYVSIDVNDLTYPTSTRMIQLVGNGLIETKDADYAVIRGKISGFALDDTLMYDSLTGTSLVTAFSGWWSRDKVTMSGGSFYPTGAQFNETIDVSRIILSGITGARFSLNSDIYMNGQKLVSGFHYKLIDDSVSGWCGGVTGLTIAVLDPNVLPALVVNGLFHPTGGLPTGIDSVEDAELAIIPNFGVYTKYYLDVTGALNAYSGVTGFNEQVWVNGVRQRLDSDYTRNFACTTASGILDEPETPFNFFNNETGYFNIE